MDPGGRGDGVSADAAERGLDQLGQECFCGYDPGCPALAETVHIRIVHLQDHLKRERNAQLLLKIPAHQTVSHTPVRIQTTGACDNDFQFLRI